jgi:pseudouridine-5'-phosphate glycosidase/pseudouridine kinase
VVGSVAIDINCDYVPLDPSDPKSPQLHTSNPGIIRQSVGGVGFNVALAANLVCPNTVILASVIGNDPDGRLIRSEMLAHGLNTTRLVYSKDPQNRTARYVAVNGKQKDLVTGVADMEIFRRPPETGKTFRYEKQTYVPER